MNNMSETFITSLPGNKQDEELRLWCIEQIVNANKGGTGMTSINIINEALKLFNFIREGDQRKEGPYFFIARLAEWFYLVPEEHRKEVEDDRGTITKYATSSLNNSSAISFTNPKFK